MYFLLILLSLTWLVRCGLKEAGIQKKVDGRYVVQFHKNPNAYLFWRIELDGTIWFTLSCKGMSPRTYCGIGITTPDLWENRTQNMFNSDIYTARFHRIDDRYGDTITGKPRKDPSQDVFCDHCGMHEGGLMHTTFWRNLTTGDPYDVAITNQTFRIIWAMGPVKKKDIAHHWFRPTKDYTYKWINFVSPENTIVPKFKDKPPEKSTAHNTRRPCALSAVTALLLSLL